MKLSFIRVRGAVADMTFANGRLFELRTEPLSRYRGELRTAKAVRTQG